MSLVFDSSAMLALLRDEMGADFVQNLLDDADVPKYRTPLIWSKCFTTR